MILRQWRLAFVLVITCCLLGSFMSARHLMAVALPGANSTPVASGASGNRVASELYLPLVRNKSGDPPSFTPNPSLPTPVLATPTANTPTPAATDQPALQGRIIGYFVSWAVYDRNFHVAEIKADRLTHINYAFANISEQGECILGDPYADTEKIYPKTDNSNDPPGTLRGSFNQLRILKEAHPHLKTLISVGGWNWSARFSDAALTPEARARFTQSCVDFMARYGFDGIDIDWEYPVGGGLAGNGARPEDKQNFTLLLAELRRALDARGVADGRDYLLSIAAPAGPTLYANFELDKIHAYLDWINVMAYDFHTGAESTTNLHAPLFAAADDPSADATQLNVDAALRAYLDAGVPAAKLIMGMPFYGHGWSGVDAAHNGLYQSSMGQPSGTWEPGIFDYMDLAANYIDAGYSRQWHAEANAPWLYSAASKIMISYDDAESIVRKTDYIRQHNLGGAMIWELSADSAGDVEGANGRTIPSLLDAIYAQLSLPAATPTPIIPTSTSTPTSTPTRVATSTSTNTALPNTTATATTVAPPPPTTATATFTSAPPATATQTPTPGPTNTPTATLTSTATATSTSTPTDTPASAVDLAISSLEVTQAVQDAANSVPLVADRATFVRVFAKVNGGTASGVEVSASAAQNGQPLGVIKTSAATISSAPTRADAASTINLTLPMTWTKGTIDLTVKVDATNVIAEGNETNNSFNMTLTFHEMPTFHAVLVPINYTHNGVFYPAPTQDTVSGATMDMYPLSSFDVTLRAPHDFAGDLRQDTEWQRLAVEINGLKTADGAPASTYYYGVVPVENANGRWFTSGVAGISAVGARFGAGLTDSPLTATHEFGHGFGLSHAPCGVSGSKDYPYPGAAIGEYGFDANGEVKEPNKFKDIMSYCSPKWVSDYTYKIIYADQLANGQVAVAAAEEVLLVRALLVNGVAAMSPIYSLWTAPQLLSKPSNYTLEIIGTAGQLMASYPARAVNLEWSPLGAPTLQSDTVATLIEAVVPAPALPMASVRLLYNNGLLAAQALDDRSNWISQVQLTVTEVGENIQVVWTMSGIPTTVRYSPDNGASWLTLAVDNTSGVLTLDPKLLPQDGVGLYQIIPSNSTTPVFFETTYP
ncbi:MAG: glycosyl hydrolase family 18 protein [Caldilineaceae bacterium]